MEMDAHSGRGNALSQLMVQDNSPHDCSAN